nr:Cof-type HAD-IIB family hydrolase [uncultured Sphaerochaeta sp.]
MNQNNIDVSIEPSEIKAIVFDMDGTLLKSDNTLSERTIKAIKALRKTGRKIFLATGRSYDAVHPFLEALAIRTPIVCFNGAAVVDALTGHPIFSHFLQESIARFLIRLAKINNVYYQAYNREGKLIYERICKESKFYEKHSGIQGSIYDFNDESALQVYKIVYIGEYDDLKRLSDEVQSKFTNQDIYSVFSMPYFFEVMSPMAGKLAALKEALSSEKLNSSEVMVFGDGQNDLEMLKWAHMGIAMENGSKELFNVVSRKTIASNNDDGVARYIEDFFELEY